MSAYLSFNNDGSGTLTFGGSSYSCKGKYGFNYTKDITLRPGNAYLSKYNQEGALMEYAVGPIQWRRGAYIHSGSLNYSIGCVHLRENDARAFYNYIKSRNSTRLVTSYNW
mmetsp:Transcript_18037/g.22146  ORF Transcript_18037/g.22146 Transcript_18037/m.22146 type:complete len:111 (-) Transcript_18037:240-572(-)